MNEFFRNFANKASAFIGSAWTFIAAVLIVGSRAILPLTERLHHYEK